MRHQNPTLCIGFLVGLACLPGHAIAQADASDTTAFIWQGFNHEWERRVVGLWSVPHRVSVLENRIGDERHSHSPEGLLSEASFHFAQSTGVDGDTMHPQGYVARVHSPDLIVQRGTLALAVSDQTQPGPVPSAFTRFEEIIAVETSADAPTHSVALIQGISFRSRCLDDVDDCNSDGLWPYRFLVDLGTCQTVATDTACPVNVEIGRAWTPNRGGVKVIEEKRVSDRMSLDILIHYVVLTGPDDTLSASRMAFENALASNRRMHFDEQYLEVPRVSSLSHAQSTVGITSFGFQFFPAGRRRDLRHRGRYVAGWTLRVRLDPEAHEGGTLRLGHSGGIFLPRTVTRTGVSVTLGMAVLHLSHPDAVVSPSAAVTGQICSDGHDAPFFSRWTRCDQVANGERLEHEVRFEQGPDGSQRSVQ